MTDRETELRALADRVRERDAVRDAWLAKSFTDRLLVVDVRADATLPADLRRDLADRDLRGANEVYHEGDQRDASDRSSGDDGAVSREDDRGDASDRASGNAASREVAEDPSFAGDVGDAERHQFVDVRTRGDHRSYVYD